MKYIFPVSILSGTIIGAGMFALPFVFYSAGVLVGLFYILSFSLVFWLTHAMYADIILRTDHEPHFVTYVKTYLGNLAYWPAVIATVFSILLVLTIYIILAPSFANLIDGNAAEPIVVYVFWVLGSLMIFFDAKKLALMELITSTGIFLIVLLIFFFGMTKLDVYQIGWFKAPVDPALFFLPFGPILFSLAGRSAIPSVLEDLRSRNIPEFLASRVIFYGTVLPAAVYIFFIIGIFGLSGEVSEDAVTGIVKTGKPLLAPLGILGLVALLSTYAPLAVSVKNILVYDFKFSRVTAGAVVVVAPIAAYLFGARNFLTLVALSGGVFLAFESFVIVLIWNKLNALGKERILLKNYGKKTAYFVAAVFAVGMIYEIVSFISKFLF